MAAVRKGMREYRFQASLFASVATALRHGKLAQFQKAGCSVGR